MKRFLSGCRKTFRLPSFGKEDSVKETHQGFLSRSINQNFELFKVQNSVPAWQKNFFGTLRFLWSLVLLLALTGCAALVPSEYLTVSPHADSGVQTTDADAVTAENYVGLKNAILNLVRTGQTEGVIRVSNYDGDVTADLPEAAYEVCKQDPLGAYAVDYMTHSCTQIVSYYEIRISITFRRTAEEIARIQSISTQYQLQERLQYALDRYSSRLTLRLSNYREQDRDIPDLVTSYCAANPGTVMETPSVSVSVFPESGSVRILEINFTYTHTPEDLNAKAAAVQQSIDAAAEYIRYREDSRDKLQLLFTYLMERFQYREAETATPLYSALCGGIADAAGLAQAWQLICDQAGVECFTVTGMRDGESCTWNIVGVDGGYRHLDLQRCVLQLEQLTLWNDNEMGSYYWNTEQYPACQPAPVVTVTDDTSPEETPTEETPSEETPTPPDESPQEPVTPEAPENP